MIRTLALAALFWSLPGFAQFGSSTDQLPGFGLPIEDSPETIVRRGVDRLAGFLIGAGNPTPDSIQTFLSLEIAPHFDFAYMARWAAGPLSRRMTDEQRTRFAAKMESMFLGALARNLGSYARPLPRVQVFRSRTAGSGKQAIVPARVSVEGAPPINLEFRFYLSRDGWLVYDVSANGASAVAFYRGYFGNLMRRHGPEAVLD